MQPSPLESPHIQRSLCVSHLPQTLGHDLHHADQNRPPSSTGEGSQKRLSIEHSDFRVDGSPPAAEDVRHDDSDLVDFTDSDNSSESSGDDQYWGEVDDIDWEMAALNDR